MEISKSGSRSINQGPAEFFTGNVQVEPLVQLPEPSRIIAASVTFEPGARSAWHKHPLGQTLIVTDGCGVVQTWGQPVQIIRPGDVIWTPPGVKHWHGALPSFKMTHISVLEHLNGKTADWLDQLTEDEYQAGCASCEPARHDLGTVSPALEKYDREAIAKLWSGSDLTAHDRSIITVAALICRNQTVEMPWYFNFALDNGLKPAELSEIITHLAFYCGWPSAISAIKIAKPIFAQRHVEPKDLPLASPELLPINAEAEKTRAANVMQQFGAVAPAVVQNTSDLVFRDLWLRPALKPRDRSLATVSALIAAGQTAQVTYHLNRAMDNGLTKTEASEVLNHLAFYVGWPNIFSALPVAKEVFENRPK